MPAKPFRSYPQPERCGRETDRPLRVVPQLSQVAAALVMALALGNSSAAIATGLGRATVLSALGQPLAAEIEITAPARPDEGQLSARLASPQAYQQAGLQFPSVIGNLNFEVIERDGRRLLRLASGTPINEPFLDLLVELNWATGRLQRQYTFLLDPPELQRARTAVAPQALPQTAVVAVQTSPPTPAPRAQQPLQVAGTFGTGPAPSIDDATRNRGRQAIEQGRNASTSAAAPAPAGAASGATTTAPETVQVRSGDTLGRIASSRVPAGASLDQMLVALLRSNPQAFDDANMNRLRAGAQLQVPSVEQVNAVSPAEARREVLAQARDFQSYRARLAAMQGRATPVAEGAAGQTAGGEIAAGVSDAAAPAPQEDQLRLAQAGSAAQAEGGGVSAVAPEEVVARERELAEAQSRIADLERTLSEMQSLLRAQNEMLAQLQAQRAAAPAPAPVPAPAPAPAAAPPAATDGMSVSGLVTDLRSNLPILGGALAALLLLILLIVRLVNKRRQMAVAQSEISPSIFGETGGQKIDTTQQTIHSQFDPNSTPAEAAEVDPIGEADLFISYGRLSQAEEIIRDALRANPERLALYTKLLEILAAQGQPAAFEEVARQLRDRTLEIGPEWEECCERGRALDPANPLYAGAAESVPDSGAPASAPAATAVSSVTNIAAGGPMVAAAAAASAAAMGGVAAASAALDRPSLGAGAAPVVPAPAESEDVDLLATASAPMDLDFDLELDSGDSSVAEPGKAAAASSGANPAASDEASTLAASSSAMEFDLTRSEVEAVRQAQAAVDAEVDDTSTLVAPMEPEFDLGKTLDLPAVPVAESAGSATTDTDLEPLALSLDMAAFEETGAVGQVPPPSVPPETDFSDTGTVADMSAYQEMATKLDLALAYVDIGDKEGARELLEEVIKDGGPDQQSKAREVLASLA